MCRYRNLVSSFAFVLAMMIPGCDSDPILAAKFDLCRYTASSQVPTDDAVVNGQVLVIYKSSNFEKEKHGECDLDGYTEGTKISTRYFPEEMNAASPAELDTLIVIENKKGKYLRSAVVRHSLERSSDVSVYSGTAEISVINYRTSTLIGKGSVETSTIPKQLPENRLKHIASTDSEYVIEPSVKEIQSHLRKFSDRVKRSPE